MYTTKKGAEQIFYKKCVLPQCSGLRFSILHRFPRNPQTCRKWLEAFDDPNLYATPHVRLQYVEVCSRHFRIEDYVHPESKKLNRLAVPSLNLKSLNELEICRQGSTKKSSWKERILKDHNNDDINSPNSVTADENTYKINHSSESFGKNDVSSSVQMNDTQLLSDGVEESLDGFQIVVNDGSIEIMEPRLESKVKADILWLRHLCNCKKCFDKKEAKTLINFFEFDANLQPIMASVIEETRKLDIIWSDGHTSSYYLNQLYEKIKKKHQHCQNNKTLLWIFQHTQYRDDLQPINWQDLMQSNNAVCYEALDRLQKSGVLIINQIPESDGDFLLKKSILAKLFSLPWSKFIIEKRKRFPTQATIPFSNLTFESMDKGLQILTVPYDKEGLTLELNLVDGFQAIEQVPKEANDFLTQFKVFYSFTNDNGYKHTTEHPVILKDKSVERVWFSVFDVECPGSEDFRQACKHFNTLIKVLKMEKNQWPVELNVNTMIVLDNYRICWCLKETPRDAELDCIYVERKHYLSSLNVLNSTTME